MRPIAVVWCALLSIIAVALIVFQGDLVPDVRGQEYYRQPSFFPVITLGLVVVVSALLAVRYAIGGTLHEDEELSGTTPHIGMIATIALLFGAYIEVVKLIGYPMATIIFAIAAALATRAASMISVAGLVALGVLLYVAFVLYLDVWFREPRIYDLLGMS